MATYYISNSGNTTNNGTSKATPWNVTKLITSWSSIVAGDKVLFNCGEEFPTVAITGKNGTKLNRAVFGSYGSGAKPKFTGIMEVTGWVDQGNNIWKATLSGYYADTKPDLKAVYKGDVIINRGRFPRDPVYLKTTVDQSTTNANTYIDVNLSTYGWADNYWNGAEVVIATREYIFDKPIVSSHTATRINFVSPITYGPYLESGFFFQNDVKCLTVENDWAYKKSTQELFIYATTAPTGIKVAYHNTTFSIANSSYFILRNLDLRRAREKNISITSCHHGYLQNCDLDQAAEDALSGSGNYLIVVEHNKFKDVQNNAITFTGNACAFLYNEFQDIAMVVGAGKPGTTGVQYAGMAISGDSNMIKRNRLKNIGYNAIHLSGGKANAKPSFVIENIIDGYCMTKEDGGAIYTYENWSRLVVQGNTVKRGAPVANPAMPNVLSAEKWGKVMGLYSDGSSSHGFWADNVVEDTKRGALSNLGENVLWEGNIFTKIHRVGLYTAFHTNYTDDNPDTSKRRSYPYVRNHKARRNTFIMADDAQPDIYNFTIRNDVDLFGQYNNNKHVHLLRCTGQIAPFSLHWFQNKGYPTSTINDLLYCTPDKVPAMTAYGAGATISAISYPRFTVLSQGATVITADRSTMDASFGSGVWVVNTASSAASFTVAKVTTGGITGATMRCRFSTAALKGDSGEAIHRFLTLNAGQWYRLRFDAKSNYAGYFDATVKLLKPSGTPNVIHMHRPFQTNTTTQSYEVIFQCLETNADHRLSFLPLAHVAGATLADNMDFYFDNVQIQEVTVSEAVFDDYAKTLTNESMQNQDFTLAGTWKDAETEQTVTFPFTVKPYTSKVLLRGTQLAGIGAMGIGSTFQVQ